MSLKLFIPINLFKNNVLAYLYMNKPSIKKNINRNMYNNNINNNLYEPKKGLIYNNKKKISKKNR